MSNILIEANNISKIYDQDIFLKRGKNIYALNNVNFQLEQGDFICIMGPSGSGKSTLLNCLSTLDQVTRGDIKVFHQSVSTMSKDELCEFRYQKTGFVFQNHNLIPYLSIYDNIAAPIILGKQKAKIIEKKVMDLAKMLEIEDILDKFPHECSGGECQRVAIARALVNQPEILFCDEPTGNLDSKNSHKLLSFLSQLNHQGTTIVLVTHDPVIASYGKTMIYIYDGGVKTTIHQNQASQKSYLEKINQVVHQDTLLYEFDKDEISYQDTNTHEDITMKVENKKKEYVSRQTVYMIIDGHPIDNNILKNSTPLYIRGSHAEFKNVRNDDISFDLKDIKEIKMDLTAQFVQFGLFSDYTFKVTLDCISDEGIYKFTLKNKDDFIDIIQHFHQLEIPLDDPRHIEEAYHQYPHDYERTKYYRRTHKDLLKYK